MDNCFIFLSSLFLFFSVIKLVLFIYLLQKMPCKIYFLSPVDCGSFIQGERCLWRKKKNQIKKKKIVGVGSEEVIWIMTAQHCAVWTVTCLNLSVLNLRNSDKAWSFYKNMSQRKGLCSKATFVKLQMDFGSKFQPSLNFETTRPNVFVGSSWKLLKPFSVGFALLLLQSRMTIPLAPECQRSSVSAEDFLNSLSL